MADHAEIRILFLTIVAIFLIFVVLPQFAVKILTPFLKKRRYIKTELERSEDEEYDFWKRKMRNLYLDNIPLLGKCIKRARHRRLRQ